MRPNKTNFGLSFVHFWTFICEGRRRREEEEEEEKKRYGSLCICDLSMEAMMILYGKYGLLDL